jgi:ATP synthase subunit 6
MKGFEVYLNQIKQIIDDLIGHSLGKHYFFQFFSFVFILINIINFLGLIPYTFVLTSQFFFTFGVAFIFFITINITGLILHGVQFLKLFYPTGTPLFIVPLLILIEVVSYIARVFSLAIRLFANITAGHILIKILSWLTWMILDIIVLSSISFILISSLWVLEFFISILQAYVFLTLLCLYLNDVVELH